MVRPNGKLCQHWFFKRQKSRYSFVAFLTTKTLNFGHVISVLVVCLFQFNAINVKNKVHLRTVDALSKTLLPVTNEVASLASKKKKNTRAVTLYLPHNELLKMRYLR